MMTFAFANLYPITFVGYRAYFVTCSRQDAVRKNEHSIKVGYTTSTLILRFETCTINNSKCVYLLTTVRDYDILSSIISDRPKL